METNIIYETRDPIFNQTFDFNLTDLMKISLLMKKRGIVNKANSLESTGDPSKGDLSDDDQNFFSQLQFIFVVMDWDQSEKSGIIGKIQLNTQRHRERQKSSQRESITSEVINELSLPKDVGDQTSSRNSPEGTNWFDIFKRPNIPVLCTLQLNNY
jgi:hypothetical protein